MRKFWTSFIILFMLVNVSFACINDSSSIFFEKQSFPDEIALISGSYQIHTKEFHEWRIKDRQNKIEKNPDNPALYDDLAVSYEKTGQIKRAIGLLTNILENNPNRYETLSNLGTFHIHNHEYEKGLTLLKKAITINPQAHYGREIYQIKAVEYILSLKKKPPFTFPIQNDSQHNFANYILKDVSIFKEKEELAKAIVGVSGMLKFGNADSPILLELLGDLYYKIAEDYLWDEILEQNNSLSNISKYFYISAFLRSGQQDKSIIFNFLNERKTVFAFSNKNEFDSSQLNNLYDELLQVEKMINEGQSIRNKYFRQEINILKSLKEPENDIYAQLFLESQIQPSLVKQKLDYIDQTIIRTKRDYVLNTTGEIVLPLFLILFFSPLFIFMRLCYLLNKTYLKVKHIGKSSIEMNIELHTITHFVNIIALTIVIEFINFSFLLHYQISDLISIISAFAMLIFPISLFIRLPKFIKNHQNTNNIFLNMQIKKIKRTTKLFSVCFFLLISVGFIAADIIFK